MQSDERRPKPDRPRRRPRSDTDGGRIAEEPPQEMKSPLPHGVVPMTPRVHAALLEQRKAFIAKIGPRARTG
jgi:hypothetical protein